MGAGSAYTKAQAREEIARRRLLIGERQAQLTNKSLSPNTRYLIKSEISHLRAEIAKIRARIPSLPSK
ncbi:MAG: hypothetical protein ACI4AM_06605 [Muribaculaceae bacterium]